MVDDESNACLPPDYVWVDLDNKLIASEAEGKRWRELVDQFEPDEHQEAKKMADWLRGCVHDRRLPPYTRAAHNDKLLGFFSAEVVHYAISNRPGPVLAVSRRLGFDSLETGLLLSAIVRSDHAGKGFGRSLIEEAVGFALKLEKETITSILVEPANSKLKQMWQEAYHFAPLSKSDLLHLPLKIWEELQDS